MSLDATAKVKVLERNQVMAGTVIAGALVMGIKSDLPGDAIATLTEPVHDTAPG
ncbi:hypothetical protein [Cupriavidus sp. PET2-C1]